MAQNHKIPILISSCLATVLLGTVAVNLTPSSAEPFEDKEIFLQNALAINRVADQFEISPRILASVLWGLHEPSSRWIGHRLNVLFSGGKEIKLNSICRMSYERAEWIEEQIANHHGPYWLGEDKALKIGKSESKQEIIEKCSSIDGNLQYTAAFLAMMIRNWKEKSIDLSFSPDTLADLCSSSTQPIGFGVSSGEVGRKAKVFFHSESMLADFPR